MSLSVEFVSLSFEDYLKQNKLTPNLVNYIHHSIAMVTNTATTLEVQHTHTGTFLHVVVVVPGFTCYTIVYQLRGSLW